MNYRVFLKSLFVFILFLQRLPLYAQSLENYKADKIIPPSPNAASLGSFGNYSQGAYNGLPSIAVPIYKANVANYSLDISLSYDASGVKPLQNASWVGLGWTLSYGGGVITREVRGKDDFQPTAGYVDGAALPDRFTYNGVYASSIPAENPITGYFQGIKNGQYDSEPDIFTYSMGPFTGRFVLDKTANGAKVLELDKSNLKITHDGQNSWKIVDGNGYSYYFGTRETSEDYSYTSTQEMSDGASITDFNDDHPDRYPVVTAWYLDSIVSPTGETISFEYIYEESLSATNKYEQNYRVLSLSGGCQGSGSSTGAILPPDQTTYSASKQIISGAVLHRIVFANGSIEFVTAPREDIESRGGSIVNRLDHILVKDIQGNVLKNIILTHTYFTDLSGENKKLKLDAIQEFSASGEALPAWKFNYYNPQMLPKKYTKAIDHWGYYNNQESNKTLLPAMLKQAGNGVWRDIGGGIRVPGTSVDALRNGVLQSITYPTGGKTNFEFELNEYTNLFGDDKYDLSNQDLLIQSGELGYPDQQHDKQISFQLTEYRSVKFKFNYYDHRDPTLMNDLIEDYASLELNGQPYITFHNYSVVDGSYTDNETDILPPGNYTMKIRALNGYVTSLEAIYMQWAPINQRKGGGLRVKRIENIDNAGNTIVKAYQYNSGAQSTGLLLNPVKYDYDVSITNGNYNLDPGGSYTCQFTGQYLSRSSSSIRTPGFSLKGGIIGYSKVTELLGDQGENGKTEYYFHNVPNVVGSGDFPLLPLNGDVLNGKTDSILVYDAEGNLVKKTVTVYSINQMETINGIKLLSIPYSTDNFLIAYYDNISSWLVEGITKETAYSKSGAVETTVTSLYENPAHRQITKREQLLSDNTLLTQQFKYPHDFQSSTTPNVYNEMVQRNIINPVIEQSTFNNTTTFVESETHNYDFWSNSTWGGTAQNSQILLHTIDSKLGANTTKTRNRFYNYDAKGNAGAFSKENDVIKSYVWGYNFSYPVAEVVGESYADVIGVLDQSIIQNPPSDQALRDELQKIRQHFPSAMVTTITYKPLIGVTSQTDLRNRTTTYEYDGFGRLKLIRDPDGNIIKTFKYNYQQ